MPGAVAKWKRHGGAMWQVHCVQQSPCSMIITIMLMGHVGQILVVAVVTLLP